MRSRRITGQFEKENRVSSEERFGKLVVVDEAPPTRTGKSQYLCKCDCGNSKTISMESLLRGKTKSCGCLRREVTSGQHKTHGQRQTRLYATWQNMKNRCLNPRVKNYPDYGGRGITVCCGWMTFEPFHAWAMDNGYREGLTIERKDINKGYSPENCEWITAEKQGLNKRTTRFITYKGEVKPLAEWSKILGIKAIVIQMRLDRLKWSIEKAFETPVRQIKKQGGNQHE